MDETNIEIGEEVIEEEEIVPKFKYDRIENDLKQIFKSDSFTCAAVHPKFLIFGSRNGRVYLLDHQGNTVDSYLNKSIPSSQEVRLNEIYVDSKGESIATCSDDGKVVIAGLFSDKNNKEINIGKPVKTLALDPDERSLAGKRLIVGDEKLTMYEKNFLNHFKSTTLCNFNGRVLSISWNGRFVAWASSVGVGVYDLNDKCSLGVIKWEYPPKTELENFRCNFRWWDSTTLFIGWVDTVRICILRTRTAQEMLNRDVQQGLFIDLISTFRPSFYICGIAPLRNINQLVVLGYPKEKDDNVKSPQPVLCVLDFDGNNRVEVSTDSLPMNGYEDCTVNDYILGNTVGDNRYFIVAPNDLVIASPFETKDHMQCLVDNGKFEEAMALLTNPSDKDALVEVSRLYVDHLLLLGLFDNAAELCVRALAHKKELLEEDSFKFVALGQLRSLSAHLPLDENSKLNSKIYEMVLCEYLQYDTAGFLNLIKEWPTTIYDASTIINEIGENSAQNRDVYEALAVLYTREEKYEKALVMYLKLKKKDIFRVMSMLVEERKFPPEVVVKQLELNEEEYLYKYLDALEEVDGCDNYHGKLVHLYAKFDREKLLPLLKRSENYPMQEAFDACKRESLYPEMVYLLGRMGNTRQALDIIIHEIKNMEMAIDFCKEYDDSDLWNILIDESLEKPEIIAKVLDAMIGFVNPTELVSKIKLGQTIPGLKQSVIKMFCDLQLQMKIQKGYKQIVGDNIFEHLTKVHQHQTQGKYITYDDYCGGCYQQIVTTPMSKSISKIVLFGCGHIFHEMCLSNETDEDTCRICAEENYQN